MVQLLILAAGIVLLIVLIMRQLSPFLALLVVALLLGIAFKMPLPKLLLAMQNGVGSTLSQLAPIIALGAIFGSILEQSGAIAVIAQRLGKAVGLAHMRWAALLVGFVVGIPLFYNAGFVLLVPLVFSMAALSGQSLVVVAISMMAALSVTHGLLPPHPSPVALAGIFNANMGKTMLYGFCIALPAAVVAGPLFAASLKQMRVAAPVKAVASAEARALLPKATLSLLTALLPILLIASGLLLSKWFVHAPKVAAVCSFLADPMVALLISVLVSLRVLGTNLGIPLKALMQDASKAIAAVAIIMLVIAAGGAFKQVLVDSGVGQIIAEQAQGARVPPLVLGWLVAAGIRLALGSATVAGLTAAGMVLPILQSSGTSPELMVLAVGAGSLFGSHVNDTGFWMFKEYFGLTLKQTLLSWSLMECIVSLMGLGGVLVIDALL
jgi:gluconate transporter